MTDVIELCENGCRKPRAPRYRVCQLCRHGPPVPWMGSEFHGPVRGAREVRYTVEEGKREEQGWFLVNEDGIAVWWSQDEQATNSLAQSLNESFDRRAE